MSDLINRQAAIDALCKALYTYEDKTEKQFIESDGLDINDWIQHRIFVQNMSDIDKQTIQNLPTIEVESIRHGRWINDNGLYKCSVCNEFTITGWANCIPIEQMNKTMKYCNNCGARMDGGENEN